MALQRSCEVHVLIEENLIGTAGIRWFAQVQSSVARGWDYVVGRPSGLRDRDVGGARMTSLERPASRSGFQCPLISLLPDLWPSMSHVSKWLCPACGGVKIYLRVFLGGLKGSRRVYVQVTIPGTR